MLRLTGIQTCYQRASSLSAKDVVVPPMPVTSFQPDPYEVIMVLCAIEYEMNYTNCFS